jgi:hypothetical protein
VDDRARQVERRLEGPLLIPALLTIPAIAIEQSDAGQPWDTIAAVVNWMVWGAFLAEIVIMLRVVPDRWRWLRDHPLDVAIVLLTPPFLPASLQSGSRHPTYTTVALLFLRWTSPSRIPGGAGDRRNSGPVSGAFGARSTR